MCLSSQAKILDMQCDLLTSSFRNPKTIALMKENIRRISDGTSPHCATALKLGFKKAFDVKKREGGVLLQCSCYRCEWHTNPVSYSSVGSKVYCPGCSNYAHSHYAYARDRAEYYMQCAGCQYKRTSSCTSCQGCGKRFI